MEREGDGEERQVCEGGEERREEGRVCAVRERAERRRRETEREAKVWAKLVAKLVERWPEARQRRGTAEGKQRAEQKPGERGEPYGRVKRYAQWVAGSVEMSGKG